ncbi:hypothetical protein [Synechococcus sp. BIOS-E4-1]|uniref:hypothetical protein n=1 Tax=Synechococcus sp. BIOS-E4-1 TaxID=1400864 RepID=UPI0016478055|nr:hypothetical protein [Synechococcus sp. BIOS-E4-1]
MAATAQSITRMRSSCPKASSVQNMRCKVFLSVRSGKGDTPRQHRDAANRLGR